MQILYCPECKSEIHPESGILSGNNRKCKICKKRKDGSDLVTLDTDQNTWFFPKPTQKYIPNWSQELGEFPDHFENDSISVTYYCPDCKCEVYPHTGRLSSHNINCQTCAHRVDTNDLVIKNSDRDFFTVPDAALEFRHNWYNELQNNVPSAKDAKEGYKHICSLHEIKLPKGARWKQINDSGTEGVLALKPPNHYGSNSLNYMLLLPVGLMLACLFPSKHISFSVTILIVVIFFSVRLIINNSTMTIKIEGMNQMTLHRPLKTMSVTRDRDPSFSISNTQRSVYMLDLFTRPEHYSFVSLNDPSITSNRFVIASHGGIDKAKDVQYLINTLLHFVPPKMLPPE